MADYTDWATAARAVMDPSTSALDLASITQFQPSMRAQVAAHPNVYPALLDWLDGLGDPTVSPAVAARRLKESDAASAPTEQPAAVQPEADMQAPAAAPATAYAEPEPEASVPVVDKPAALASRALPEPAPQMPATDDFAEAPAWNQPMMESPAASQPSDGRAWLRTPLTSQTPLIALLLMVCAALDLVGFYIPYLTLGWAGDVGQWSPAGHIGRWSWAQCGAVAGAVLIVAGVAWLASLVTRKRLTSGSMVAAGILTTLGAVLVSWIVPHLLMWSRYFSASRGFSLLSGLPQQALMKFILMGIVLIVVLLAAVQRGATKAAISIVGCCLALAPVLGVGWTYRTGAVWWAFWVPLRYLFEMDRIAFMVTAAALLMAALVAGILLIVAVNSARARQAQQTLRTVILILLGVCAVASVLVPVFASNVPGSLPISYYLWLNLPFILFLAAVAVLVAGLSADPSKTYYATQEDTWTPDAPAGQTAPLYAMMTMPDGTQQLVPVTQPAASATRSGKNNSVGVIGLVLGIVSVAGLVASEVVSRTTQCTINYNTWQVSCPGQTLSTTFVWISLVTGIVGLVFGIVGIANYRNRSANNLAVSIVGVCLASIILIIFALALLFLGSLL